MIKLSKLGKTRFVTAIKKRKSLNKRIKDLEDRVLFESDRLCEIDTLIKRLFEKYINDKISEEKFYELDRLYDQEKMTLIKNQRINETEMTNLKNIENDINLFYDLLESYDKLEELKKEDITHFIEKLVILEKKNKYKKRIVKVYYRHIGLV
jgi:DNA-directed RNA polymerase